MTVRMNAFYQGGLISAIVDPQGTWRRLGWSGKTPLSEYRGERNGLVSLMVASDHAGSVLSSGVARAPRSISYNPYGFSHSGGKDQPSLKFNAAYIEPMGLYLLGNGVRAYSPQLMRFCSTDALSPFHRGGLNAYAYCLGDPVNRNDPSGRTAKLIKWFGRKFAFIAPKYTKAKSQIMQKANDQTGVIAGLATDFLGLKLAKRDAIKDTSLTNIDRQKFGEQGNAINAAEWQVEVRHSELLEGDLQILQMIDSVPHKYQDAAVLELKNSIKVFHENLDLDNFQTAFLIRHENDLLRRR